MRSAAGGPAPGLARRLGAAAAALLLLGACTTVQVGRDPLTANLPPDQAKVCRAAVQDELRDHGVAPDWVRLIDYQAIAASRSRHSNRITGFEAWIYPKNGEGALVMVLNESCQVTRMWAHGAR